MMYANEEEEQQTTSPQSRPVKKPSGLAPLKLQLKTKVKNLDAVDGGACIEQEDFTTNEIITPESSTCSSVTSDSTPSSPALAAGGKRQTRPTKKPIKLQKKMHLDKLQVPTKTKQEPKEGFELTESGTFRLEDITISQHGFKNGEMKQVSSSCTPTTITPFTPEREVSSAVTATSPCNLSTPLSTTPPSTSHMSFLHHDIPYESLLIKRKSRLGSGASANVLRVTYQDKPYALKIIPLYTGELNPSLIVREIRALYASMQCPYVVHFYEAYCREGSIKILLEYMDCNSLDDVYKIAGKIPEDVLSEISYQILQGLKYLQEQKIVHRDIKPSNILLNKQGRVKISDFGMSKQSGASVEAFKTFQGTYMYMSPERLRGDTHSFDSDIWSLGLTVAECALAKFPFNMDQFGVWEVLQYITDNGLDISTKDVSQELLDFITACCQVDPSKRPSAEELLQYPFITMYNQSSRPDGDYIPERTVRWIEEVYLKKKKQRALSMSGSTSSASSASAIPMIRKSSIKEDNRHVSPEKQNGESPAIKTTPRKSSGASLTPRKSSVVESASGTSTPRRSSNATKPSGSLSRKSSMKGEVHTSSVALDPQKLFEGLEYEGKHDVKEN